MLGTSGQNVDDVAKYSSHEDGLQLLGACLEWAHLAPTGPDTLTVYPFKNSDPFVLNQAPHVMFAGNQAKFQTSWFSNGECSPDCICTALVNCRCIMHWAQQLSHGATLGNSNEIGRHQLILSRLLMFRAVYSPFQQNATQL